jgi:hypothetical protein
MSVLDLRRRPAIYLARNVSRRVSACSFCGYEIVPYDAAYSLCVGGVSLGPQFCSVRCSTIEARIRRRGLLVLQYGDLV